ncbi:thioredoxin family protein [Lentilitoribacter sp. Alg239-R112]|uniref:thioredoxin family protein n=1 Tax=Lentilitoribacter sp. Alg239-R112 TaxID=2305987 RepID=UPI0013A6D3B5|nr:thioredoxin family protein [Lentilitoribacter sp. Alg239-R112]
MALLDTPLCDFGWQAPDFTLSDAHGKIHTMSEHMGENCLLIAFICNHCPYVKTIAHRLATDTDELIANGINVLAVMSNDYRDYAEDSPENMIKFAAQHGFNFPYLVDETQEVGKAYGAICTPDFFGLNKKGELQYRGRLDNGAMGSSPSELANRDRELFNAMMQVGKTGEGPRQQNASMGCSIKWS